MTSASPKVVVANIVDIIADIASTPLIHFDSPFS
jgi:hypothetical protein